MVEAELVAITDESDIPRVSAQPVYVLVKIMGAGCIVLIGPQRVVQFGCSYIGGLGASAGGEAVQGSAAAHCPRAEEQHWRSPRLQALAGSTVCQGQRKIRPQGGATVDHLARGERRQ